MLRIVANWQTDLLRKCLTGRLLDLYTSQLCFAKLLGGDEENRTPDPLLARQVLSQLSYTPVLVGRHSVPVHGVTMLRIAANWQTDLLRKCLTERLLDLCTFAFAERMLVVGLSGLEPPTSRLSGVRSNRLSYRPMQGFGFEFPLFPFFLINISF